jgi:hypothetical protein
MSTICLRFLSWNLKDFGNYDYSSTMSNIVQTVLTDGADVFAIMEVVANRRVKSAKIGKDLILEGAKVALKQLCKELNRQDKVSKWMYAVSGVNAGNKDRDAYAFFWKSTPAGSTTDPLYPTGITLKQGPDILRKDGSGKELKFGNSRRPAACLFELTNAAANPATQQIWVVSFHACANFDKETDIKNAIKDCTTACSAIAGTTPVIIGSDTNLDYTSNQTFFNTLQSSSGFDVEVTDGVGSSLLGKVDTSGSQPKVAENAYDNIFGKKVKKYTTRPVGVINVIKNMAQEKQKKQPTKGKKRPLEADIVDSFNTFITKDLDNSKAKKGKTAGVSDHLPVTITVQINQ